MESSHCSHSISIETYRSFSLSILSPSDMRPIYGRKIIFHLGSLHTQKFNILVTCVINVFMQSKIIDPSFIEMKGIPKIPPHFLADVSAASHGSIQMMTRHKLFLSSADNCFQASCYYIIFL